MTILDWLLVSMRKLAEAGVDSPRRDCLVLLEDTILKDRAWIISHPEFELKQEQIPALNGLIERRIRREPLAYIRGRAWFYRRFFKVNPSVLIPRPESESFIELLIKVKPDHIIDIGTGSGALAITAKLELPRAEVFASDIDAETLKIARKNAAEHKVNITFKKGFLLKPWIDKNLLDRAVILANLPYVPEGMITSPEITKEPRAALFSGQDGLEHYQDFWQQIAGLKLKPELVLTESLETQHKGLAKMAEKAGYTLQKTEILVQQYRLTA